MTRRIRIGARLLLLTTVCMLWTSCDKYEYSGDLQALGARVEKLESDGDFNIKKINERFLLLQELVNAVEKNGYVTDVTENLDGSYTITFSTGNAYTLRQGIDGEDGQDGKELEFLIDVEKGSDGIYYWKINGNWLLDDKGNKVPASAIDGKDGKSSAEIGAKAPEMRISPNNRTWQISTDGGNTWTDTGIAADGKNGTNGTDGPDDIFVKAQITNDGKSVTFTLRDGRIFTVPLSST